MAKKSGWRKGGISGISSNFSGRKFKWRGKGGMSKSGLEGFKKSK